jgi:hypothetical protein
LLESLFIIFLAAILVAVGQPVHAPPLAWPDVSRFFKVLLGVSVPCVFAGIALMHGKARREQRIAAKAREPRHAETVAVAAPTSRLAWTRSERGGLLAFVYGEGFAFFILGGVCGALQGLGGNSDGAFLWFATDLGSWSGAFTMPVSVAYMFVAASMDHHAMPTWREVARVLLVEALVIGILADLHVALVDRPILTEPFAWSDLRTFAIILAGTSCVSAVACGLAWLDARRRERADL